MNKIAIQYGVISGIATVIFSLLLYIIGLETYANWWLQLVGAAFVIVFMIIGGLQVRRANGGFLTYKNSFISLFVIAAISGLIAVIFNILLYNVINPDLGEAVKDINMERTIGMMEEWNVPEAQIEEAIQDLEDLPQAFTVGGQLISYLKGLVFWLVLSLLLALIPKRTPENEDAVEVE